MYGIIIFSKVCQGNIEQLSHPVEVRQEEERLPAGPARRCVVAPEAIDEDAGVGDLMFHIER